MKVKVSDYIVDFFIQKGVTDAFGYPGGMVTHLMESFSKKEQHIKAHVNYHEQASAFCACGYAQISGIPGVAYATSGPGATNLITGICDAYFDSIPAIFITGQVNTFESKKGLGVRQKGFQETDIVSMVKEVTKYCCYVENENAIQKELEKAWYIANEGRKGPVLLDIPMNVFRAIVETEDLECFEPDAKREECVEWEQIIGLLEKAKRPVMLLGAGTKTEHIRKQLKTFLQKYPIPTVTSMPAFDVLESTEPLNYGFVGAYGDRTANFIVAKCDLLLAIGTRMDVRQIGAQKENFAPNAKLIRVEIDEGELSNSIKDNEIQVKKDAGYFIDELICHNPHNPNLFSWTSVCNSIRTELQGLDDRTPNAIIRSMSRAIPSDVIITTDVGQNQVWVAQSFETKSGQKVLFSGGHGAMGYSLPAAIGAYYAGNKNVISFNGDGGIQMNIQELQFVSRENIPVTIVILNNKALGMIRHFQEMYFDSNYYQTVVSGGYDTPDFEKIAGAYGLKYTRVETVEDVSKVDWQAKFPQIVEAMINEKTYVFPKLEFGKPNQDQEPLIDRELYARLMEL